MAQPLSTPHRIATGTGPARKPFSAPALVGGIVAVVVLVGTLLLWWHYGTAVFFETIAAGISACL